MLFQSLIQIQYTTSFGQIFFQIISCYLFYSHLSYNIFPLLQLLKILLSSGSSFPMTLAWMVNRDPLASWQNILYTVHFIPNYGLCYILSYM